MAGMTWYSPWTFPERILTMGVQGTGKSKALFDIAANCPDVRFRIVDTDYSQSAGRLLELGYPDLTNVEYRWVDQDDFVEMHETIEEFAEATDEGDWLGVDSMTPTWTAAATWFINNLHGEDDDAFFMAAREELERQNAKAKAKGEKQNQTLGALKGWTDYTVINKAYRRRIYAPIRRCKGHVYMTSEVTSLSDDDDKEIRNLFGRYKIKPAGQRSLGNFPSTVLLLTTTRTGEWNITTIKDRERPEFDDDELEEGFFKEYIRAVAKFKPRKWEEDE